MSDDTAGSVRGKWGFSSSQSSEGNAGVKVSFVGDDREATTAQDLSELAAGLSASSQGRPVAWLVLDCSRGNAVARSMADLLEAEGKALKERRPGTVTFTNNALIDLTYIAGQGDAYAVAHLLKKLAPDGRVRLLGSNGQEAIVCNCSQMASDPSKGSWSAGCTVAGEDALLASLRVKPPLPYFPPRYLKENLAGELVPHLVLWQLATSQAMIRSAKGLSAPLNPVADGDLLANALVEKDFNAKTNTASHSLINSNLDYYPQILDDVNKVTGKNYDRQALRNLHIDMGWGFNLTPSKQEVLINGLLYTLVFNFKTGAYADSIRGKNATEKQRVALYNGVGKAMTRIGPADAGHHANKVIALRDALLQAGQNLPVKQAFEGYGGKIFKPAS